MVSGAVEHVQAELRARADPGKARGMASYMYSSRYRRLNGHVGEMPFYGVQKAGRESIVRTLRSEFAPKDREEYEALVGSLWALPHREERYLALGAARAFPKFIDPESLPLFRRLIVEGAWWDLVDDAATHLVRELVLSRPTETWPVVDAWNGDANLWLRRSSIICQVGAREKTDAERLFRYCTARLEEDEFFIRKAIGWALREHSKTDPVAVADFVRAHGPEMAGLTLREASKYIGESAR